MEKTWDSIRAVLASRLQDAQYKVWIAPLSGAWDGSTLRLAAVNDFAAGFLRNRFSSVILEAATQVLGQAPALCIASSPAGAAPASSLELAHDSGRAGLVSAASGLGPAASDAGRAVEPLIFDARGQLGPEGPARPGAGIGTGIGAGTGASGQSAGSFSGRLAGPAQEEAGVFSAFVGISAPELAQAQALSQAQPGTPAQLQAGASGQPAAPAFSSPSGSQPGQTSLPLRWGEASRLLRPWRFRFEDFVVGPCNELAHAAARSICKTDSSRSGCDLLFMTSAPGLGKTHLMQSVGAGLAAASNLRAPRVEYLSAEEFATQMRVALRCGEIDRFKARYREADVLLLEDIHFLQDKEKTQDEVLATISRLLERGSRVVLSSSFALRDLRKLDGQLLSRLGSGLLACIDKPDLETRRRIISHKAAAHSLRLSEDVASFLAENINSDIRQIEGCLRSLALKASLLNHCIDMEMARLTVADYTGGRFALSLPLIIRLVCQGFGVDPEDLGSKSRKQIYVHARNAVYYLARKHTELSLQEIGRAFGRSHSTVIKGITSLEREISRGSSLGRQLSGTINLVERNVAQV